MGNHNIVLTDAHDEKACVQEGNTQVVSSEMYSEYDKPLLGDLAISFSDSEAETREVTLWIVIPLILIAALLALIIYRRQRRTARLPPK
jgi:hypothetical protein